MKRKIVLTYLSPLVSVLGNLLLAYVVYFIARMTFLAENWNLYSDNLSWSHLMEMLRGGLMFDTTAILYTNALWVVMVLFPLHLKETKTYHEVCRWVFVVINTLTLIVNLVDTVYFRYSMRRTTTTIFQEFENENNLGGIFWTEMVSHWYFFLLTGLVAWGLWRLYIKPRTLRKDVDWRWCTLALLVSLLGFTPFCVAGMRGGWTRDIRPITVSNANNYCDRPTETGPTMTPSSWSRYLILSISHSAAIHLPRRMWW